MKNSNARLVPKIFMLGSIFCLIAHAQAESTKIFQDPSLPDLTFSYSASDNKVTMVYQKSKQLGKTEVRFGKLSSSSKAWVLDLMTPSPTETEPNREVFYRFIQFSPTKQGHYEPNLKQPEDNSFVRVYFVPAHSAIEKKQLTELFVLFSQIHHHLQKNPVYDKSFSLALTQDIKMFFQKKARTLSTEWIYNVGQPGDSFIPVQDTFK